MIDKNRKDQFVAFDLSQIEVTETYCKNAYEKELAYLESINPDCLLAGFREVAGLRPKAVRYPGWESTEIQGHTLGHYLSALSQAYASQRAEKLKEKIDYICQELRKCQRADGYLFAWSEEIFDRVEQHKPAWVPWYTMHKIFQGLLQAYHLGKNQMSYEVLMDLGEWVYRRCKDWTPGVRQWVLGVEYGGMNSVLYDLYQLTKNVHFKKAAQQFDEESLFKPLSRKKDLLNGLHANTTIPKVIGALKRYLVEGDTYYLKVAQNFWEIVVTHHTYATGGNSEWEHFGEPDVLDRERTACNCETCNVYNMLKLTKMLFEITGDKKYGDFYERTWTNAILSSQNPETGMTTYFQPMATGYFKVFGTPYSHFWCCTGTGMENFTKLGDGIYFHHENAIYINRYISSKLNWIENNITLTMKADLLDVGNIELDLEAKDERQVEIYFRIPWWNKGEACVYVDDKETVYSQENGYGYITLYGHQKIKIQFNPKVYYEPLKDHVSSVAFMYGPIVLCAHLGKETMTMTQTGVDVLVPTKDLYIKDYLLLIQDTVSTWLNHIENHLTKVEGEMLFKLKGTDEDQNLIFKPYFNEYTERYGIYWYIFQQGSIEEAEIEKERKKQLAHSRVMIDSIPVGNDQYELAHQIKGEATQASGLDGHRCRLIKGKGWFSYILKWSKEAKYLNVTYWGNEEASQFSIWINGQLLKKEELKKKLKTFYIVSYKIPSEFLEAEQEEVEVLFKTEAISDFCRIFDELFVSTEEIK